MNRRRFIQFATAALASIPVLRHVVAPAKAVPIEPFHQGMKGLPYIVENSGMYHGLNAYQGDPYSKRHSPIVKVTGVWLPQESVPYDCEVNESAYIELPKIRPPLVFVGSHLDVQPDAYRIYAPQHGFNKTGPWYFLKEVRYRDAKRSRFTIAVDYQDSDLIAQLMPGEYERLTVTFPKAEPDQTHWMIYGGRRNPDRHLPSIRPYTSKHPVGIFLVGGHPT